MLGLGLEIASVPSASTFVIGVIPRAKKIEKRMNKDFFLNFHNILPPFFCYNFITYNTKMKAVTIMKEKYFPILRAILKNKNVPEDSLEIIKKDDFIIFYQVDFDITNFEILNTFGQIGVKFELITAYEKWISRNTSDYKV